MCVVGFEDIPDAVERLAVGVILSDHHYWGGLRASVDLAGICRTFDLGSPCTRTHTSDKSRGDDPPRRNRAQPHLRLDTHWPWKDEDVVVPEYSASSTVPYPCPRTGTRVELDEEALARLHQQYLDCGLTKRDDTAYMQSVAPTTSRCLHAGETHRLRLPWDFVGDDEFVARVAALELDAVALAATYHAARLGTPLHPSRRVLEITDSACYVPVRDEAWRGHRLRPSPPDWLEGPDAFGAARDALAASGIALTPGSCSVTTTRSANSTPSS